MPLSYSPEDAPTRVPSNTPTSATAAHPAACERLPIRVVIAMSDELERMAWGLIVGNDAGMELIAKVASCDEALAILSSGPSDVVLLDEVILNGDQYGILQKYSGQPSSVRFVLVALHQPDHSLKRTRPLFIHAHLLKGTSAKEVLETIRSAASAPFP